MDEDEEILERERMIFDDPRELPRTGATVLRLRSGRLDLETFPRVFTDRLGLIKSEATKLCQQESEILVDNIDPKLAAELVRDLAQLGEEAIVVPAADLLMLPRAFPIHALQFTKSGIAVRATTEDWTPLAWTDLRVLVLAQVAFEEEHRKSTDSALTRRISPGGALGGVAGAVALAAGAPPSRTSTVRSSALHQLLDLVTTDGQRHLRIDARHFDYSILGDQLQAGSLGNILTLARWLLHYAPHMRTNVDTEKLMKTGTAPLPSHSAHGVSDVAQWLLNLQKFGY